MWSFLTFNSFISDKVLILIYYIFAFILPIFLWNIRNYILKKATFLGEINHDIKEFYSQLSLRNKLIIIALFFMIFFCMELCLRMMFEMMIGYFNIHNYLQTISNK